MPTNGGMLTYLKGDALEPKVAGNKIICHVCNDIGGWGAGFVLAISKKWKQPEQEYRNWFKSDNKPKLGECQFVQVEDNIHIANMIAQRGIHFNNYGEPPIRYEELKSCLLKVANYANQRNATIHMPRIGCGLAGGNWDTVEKIIMTTLLDNNINSYVYTLPEQNT